MLYICILARRDICYTIRLVKDMSFHLRDKISGRSMISSRHVSFKILEQDRYASHLLPRSANTRSPAEIGSRGKRSATCKKERTKSLFSQPRGGKGTWALNRQDKNLIPMFIPR